MIGLASRLAAGVGLGLSLTFFLTAGWQVRPFFYGADVPFAAGWLTLLLARHGGLPSVDATLLCRHRSERGLGPAELVGVPFDRLQQQCAQANDHGRCASAAGDPCAGAGCPLAGARPAPAAQDASRRAFLAAAGKAAGMALATLSATAGTAPLVAGREEPHAAGQRSGRQRVGYLWEVPVGHAEPFELPRSREPAIMVASPRTAGGLPRGLHPRPLRRRLRPQQPPGRLACHGAEFDPAVARRSSPDRHRAAAAHRAPRRPRRRLRARLTRRWPSP